MNFFKFLKSIVIRSDDLTPKSIEITPNGSANTTTTITSSQTADRVVTIPDGSGVVVLEDLAQELTNKEIDGHLNTISNLEVSNFNPTAIVTDLSGTPTDNQLLTAAGVKSELAALTDQDITSVYTPTNYIPVPVGAEDPDKVSAHLKGINSALVDQYRSQLDFQYISTNGTVEISKHTSAVIPGLGITEDKTLTFKATSEYYINETFQVVNVTSYNVFLRTSDSNLITVIPPGWAAAIKILNGSNIPTGISSSFSIYQFPVDTVSNTTIFNMRGKVVNNVANPVVGSDAANKTYVDSMVSPFLPLPSQAGNDGKFLGTDGTNLSWKDVTPASALITIDNNQTTPKAISTFNVDSSIYRSFNAEYWIKRTTQGTPGVVDTAFLANTQSFNSAIYSLAEQSNGQILVGGNFNVLPNKNKLTRLNPDGTTDNSFLINAVNGRINDIVRTLTTQSDNKILMGGSFTDYNGVSDQSCLVRLNPDGTTDNTFSTNAVIGSNLGSNATIYAITVRPNGKILIGGNFGAYKTLAGYNLLAQLNSDGTIDTGFMNTAIDGKLFYSLTESVRSIAVQSDDKLLFGGNFTYNTTHYALVRLNANYTIDTTFRSNATFDINDTINAIKIQPNGQILVGGDIINYKGTTGRNHLVRLNPDGTTDTSFCVNATDGKFNGSVQSIDVRDDGKIYITGSFTNYDGVTNRSRVIRLNSDGTTDTSFCIAGTDGVYSATTNSILIANDNKVYVGGNSTTKLNVYLSDVGELKTETGTLRGLYIDETNEWFIDNTALKSANVVLDMNTNDELTYTSSNMTASNYDGKMRFKIMNKLEK